ncbi:MAG: PAS domain S-box protein [Pseudomonadota bacterium]
MKIARILAKGSFKRQIIVVFAFGFFLLVSAIVAYLTMVERASLYQGNARAAQGLAQSLAVSSRSWVLANDVVGLQEIIVSVKAYPELAHAMVISPTGRVLAHSDPSKVGLYLTDATSRSLNISPLKERVLIDDVETTDVAAPILFGQRHVGWARVALTHERINADVGDVVMRSMFFVVLASLLAFVAAILIANRLGARIATLVQAAEGVRNGDFSSRAQIAGRNDEITSLADSFNRMLDVLEANEKELRTASHYSRSLIEANLDPLLTIEASGTISDVNRATEEVTGKSRDALIGSKFADCFTEADQACELIARALHDENLTDHPLSFLHVSGRMTDVLFNAVAFRHEDSSVKTVLAAARDITERKQAEAVRAQLAAIVESSSEAIVAETKEGIITHWNKAAEAIYGYAADEVIGKSVKMLIPPARQADAKAYLERISCGDSVAKHESERVRKDGSIFQAAVSLSPIRGTDGVVVGVSSIVRDITEQKRNEEELQRYRNHLEDEVRQRTMELEQARNAAEAANRAKSVFLANMSHELRTPLNAILGFSSMMRHNPQLQDDLRQYVDIINRSGEHLLTLINDVLDMAKIEAGRIELDESPFDLGAMIRDITDMMEIRAKEKGIQLLVDQSSRFPRYIVGDEMHLRQVLINLLGNAVKFTVQGGVTIRLGTKTNTHAHLIIEIEDTGPGISDEDKKIIFDPFVQLGEQGLNKGTGLGLTISRQFVQLMGGRIHLESVVGQGSVFRIELPLKEAAESMIHKINNEAHGDVSGLAPGQPEVRVLIVEDQLDNQLLLSKLMNSVGIKYKIAENGQQGVEVFQSWHPQLIWMDRRMPLVDGIEATKRIRKLPGGDKVKIVAVTASAFKDQRAELFAAGMDDFVRKPYRSSEIYESLSRQLGLKFIYNDSDTAQPEAETPLALNAEMFAHLPQPLRAELKQAVESLESERITLAIQGIKDHDPALYATVSRLADSFDYPSILNALEEKGDA